MVGFFVFLNLFFFVYNSGFLNGASLHGWYGGVGCTFGFGGLAEWLRRQA